MIFSVLNDTVYKSYLKWWRHVIRLHRILHRRWISDGGTMIGANRALIRIEHALVLFIHR
jgi:hypothetical protein